MIDVQAETEKRVIIVEDERIIALDLQRSLIKLGYTDTVALAFGEHAISVGLLCPPALVLMDLRIHGPIDGFETARRMRAHADFALIYLTGGMDQDACIQAERYPPDAWLYKPFATAQLEAAITHAFTLHALRHV